MGNGVIENAEGTCCERSEKGCIRKITDKVIPAVSEKVHHLEEFIEKETDTAISSVANKLDSLSDKIQGTISDEGMIHSAVALTSQTLRSGSSFLRAHHVRDFGRAVVIRAARHTILTFCIGLLCGIFIGYLL